MITAKKLGAVSFDSSDAKGELTRAKACARKNDIQRTIRHIGLAQDILNDAVKRLKQKDQAQAKYYLSEIF